MASVPFFGKDAVLAAYNNRGIDTWGVFESRHLLNVGDTADELAACLDMLCAGGTAGTYTLCVYKSVEPDDVSPKTEVSGSFRFKLQQSANATLSGLGVVPGGGGAVGKLNTWVEGEIGKIIEDRLNGAGKPEKKKSFEDVLMGFLDDPEKLAGIVNTIASVKSMFTGVPVPMIPGMVAGTSPARRAGQAKAEPQAADEDDPEMLAWAERTDAVMQRLEAVDPAILDHLEKLAQIAEQKPQLFKMLIANLESL
jgi:hypothetical protein